VATDLVCGMIVDEDEATAKYDYKGNMHYFCSVACREAFSKDPDKFLKKPRRDQEQTAIRSYSFIGLRPYLNGVAAAMGVVGFYLGFLTLTSDWYNARSQFGEYGMWILLLAVGLGVQATLFSLYRAWHRGESMKAAKYSLAASGGISTTAMAACCAHYLVVILPVLGLPFLSAAAAGLAGYQTYFFLAGVVSNLFGIGLMVRMMYRSGMIQPRGFACHWTYKSQQLG
jgi:YHS domain-containing protein/uncharacterized membrane protein